MLQDGVGGGNNTESRVGKRKGGRWGEKLFRREGRWKSRTSTNRSWHAVFLLAETLVSRLLFLCPEWCVLELIILTWLLPTGDSKTLGRGRGNNGANRTFKIADLKVAYVGCAGFPYSPILPHLPPTHYTHTQPDPRRRTRSIKWNHGSKKIQQDGSLVIPNANLLWNRIKNKMDEGVSLLRRETQSINV